MLNPNLKLEYLTQNVYLMCLTDVESNNQFDPNIF